MKLNEVYEVIAGIQELYIVFDEDEEIIDVWLSEKKEQVTHFETYVKNSKSAIEVVDRKMKEQQ